MSTVIARSIVFVLLAFFTVFAGLFSKKVGAQDVIQQTICGEDDRQPSNEKPVGRLVDRLGQAGCTVTLVSEACAVTAGHCQDLARFGEFNTKPSQNGKVTVSLPEDIYHVEKNSVIFKSDGIGQDYAVLRFERNAETGFFPGEVQGYLPIVFETPKVGTKIRITGYGSDKKQHRRHFAQQTHVGQITKLRESALYHIADTMGGNSGSAIIDEDRGEIIGIHSHGGCGSFWGNGGANAGTLIAEHSYFQKAVEKCIAETF